MPHRLNAFLSASNELSQLTQKAGQLITLQQLVDQVIPKSLKRSCRVLYFKQNTLTLAADNGAVAAKLRQMTGELATHLREKGCEVTGIQVQVQVNAPAYVPPPTARTLSNTAKSQLSELAELLADSPLKAALARMASRRK